MTEALRQATPLAALLASQADESPEPEGGQSYLLFEAGGESFAVAAAAVERIVARPFIAPLPSAPPSLLGVASVLGRMRLAVDISASRGAGRDAAHMRLIALHGDAQFALVADAVVGVFAGETEGGAARVRVGDRDAALVDPERPIEI